MIKKNGHEFDETAGVVTKSGTRFFICHNCKNGYSSNYVLSPDLELPTCHMTKKVVTDPNKLSYDELNKKIRGGPLIGSDWKHYKNGNSYRIIDVAILESNQELMVVYRPTKEMAFGLLTQPPSFVRPASEWEDLIFYGCEYIRRFTKLD